MALQDLTPQLRTRLGRVERAVGFFVTVATLLLLVGFAYYLWHTAQLKGWLKTKVDYSTSLLNAAGLEAGQPVKLMGFNVGEVTRVEPEAPGNYYGVTIYFRIKEPYYGYIWLDSKVRVAPADFLGNRNIEIVKGWDGHPTVQTATNGAALAVLDSTMVNNKFKELTREILKENPGFTEHSAKIDATNALNELIRQDPAPFHVALDKAKPYWIEPLESPALAERLETLVNAVEVALPNVLALTNRIGAVLTNADEATAELALLLTQARPALSNITVITDNLRDPKGSLGEWILPTNLHNQVELTLKSADSTLRTAEQTLASATTTLRSTDTNVTMLVSNINASLENLASLTSNLNAQVYANTNILSEISSAIVHTDELVQGLKRHWLLRSAFKTNKTEKAEQPKTPQKRLMSPRESR